MTAYYNEIEPYAAEWLRNLITAGHIAPGVVDTRSIEDVHPGDLQDFTQCHFFAGIGVWSLALRRAGWSDDRPVWTGSCPCQPFSAAGQGAGFADERHLWPAFHHLIRHGRPPVVLGEQVASNDADPWIDLVQDDMEGLGYRFGAIPFPAAGVGAPNIRDRLYWMADAGGARTRWDAGAALSTQAGMRRSRHPDGSEVGNASIASCSVRGLAYAGSKGLSEQPWQRAEPTRLAEADEASRPGPTNGYWRDADWLGCRDGKWRPVEPGTFPLAHGATSRVGRLRAYGNAINAVQAQIWIEAVMECQP